MSRIESVFKSLSERKEKALIAYVMAGDPSLAQTAEIVFALEKAGADLIELGVPFSDPVADGPTIQKAAERALRQGTTLRAVLDLVSVLRRQTKIPVILMTYCNPIYAFGLPEFFKEAKGAGVDGLIVPDLPQEESKDFLSLARRNGIDLIFMVAPTTPPERAERVMKEGSGFVYYVSLTGITGVPLTEKASVRERIRRLKEVTDLPVAVGFGISTPEDAKAMAEAADGIIVGSALVKTIEAAANEPAHLSRLSELIASLKAAVRS